MARRRSDTPAAHYAKARRYEKITRGLMRAARAWKALLARPEDFYTPEDRANIQRHVTNRVMLARSYWKSARSHRASARHRAKMERFYRKL